MAKQSGIHQLRGKIAGMSYYTQKGVAEGLVKKINEALSDRVKTDDAYINTRANAAEFGAAGSYSGAVIRTISKRWRTILNSFSTGYLQKTVVALIKTDATGKWGQRGLTGSAYQDIIRQRIEEFVKFSFRDNVLRNFSSSHTAAVADRSTYTLNLDTASEDFEVLRRRGADGVVFEAYAQRSVFGGYDANAGEYAPSASDVEFIGTYDHAIGTAATGTITGDAAAYLNADETMTNVLLIALPYKTIGGEKNTLQELCSMAIVPSFETAE